MVSEPTDRHSDPESNRHNSGSAHLFLPGFHFVDTVRLSRGVVLPELEHLGMLLPRCFLRRSNRLFSCVKPGVHAVLELVSLSMMLDVSGTNTCPLVEDARLVLSIFELDGEIGNLVTGCDDGVFSMVSFLSSNSGTGLDDMAVERESGFRISHGQETTLSKGDRTLIWDMFLRNMYSSNLE